MTNSTDRRIRELVARAVDDAPPMPDFAEIVESSDVAPPVDRHRALLVVAAVGIAACIAVLVGIVVVDDDSPDQVTAGEREPDGNVAVESGPDEVSSSPSDDRRRFCELTLEIAGIHADANDEPLTPEARRAVRVKVEELAPLVPPAYADDYRLRYWPTTSVDGLDTSGVSTQRAYERMSALFERTCGSTERADADPDQLFERYEAAVVATIECARRGGVVVSDPVFDGRFFTYGYSHPDDTVWRDVAGEIHQPCFEALLEQVETDYFFATEPADPDG